MFKLIKLIFKLVFILFLSIIGFVIFLVFMMYKDAKPPVEYYETSTVTIDSVIASSFDGFLTSPDYELNLNANKEDINSLIFEGLKDPNVTTDKLVETENYDLIAIWVETKTNEVHVKGSAHVKAMGITYKTQLHLGFELTEITEEDALIELKLVNLNIGKMPFAWISGVADFILKQFFKDLDIEKMVEDQLGMGAEFNLKDRKLTIDLQQVAQNALEDDQKTRDLVLLLIDVLYVDNDLLAIDITEEHLGLVAKLGQLSDPSAIKKVPELSRLNTETDFEAFMAYKSTSILMSLLAEDKKVSFSEFEFNQLVWYLLGGNLTNEVISSEEMIPGYIVEIGIPYANINNNLQLEIPIKLHDVNDVNKFFQTKIKITTNLSLEGDDLLINVNVLEMGVVTLENDEISLILALLDDNEMFSDGAIKIKDFKKMLSISQLSVEDVSVSGSFFELFVSVDANTNELIDEIKDVLSDLSNDPNIPNLGNQVSDIVDNLEDPEALDEAINDFISAFDDLDESEQQEFYDYFVNLIDPDLLGSLFGE